MGQMNRLNQPDPNAALRQRLTDIAGFTPADGWHHIISSLRAGRLYVVRKSGGKTSLQLV